MPTDPGVAVGKACARNSAAGRIMLAARMHAAVRFMAMFSPPLWGFLYAP
jgi:hypothetical protein